MNRASLAATIVIMKAGLAIILTSVSSDDEARQIATHLVESGLAACVQISAAGLSIYRWKDELQQEQERYLSIKTVEEKAPSVIEWLTRNHPYDTPEIVKLDGHGADAYMQWLRDSVQ